MKLKWQFGTHDRDSARRVGHVQLPRHSSHATPRLPQVGAVPHINNDSSTGVA
jgi:hypothetical protein